MQRMMKYEPWALWVLFVFMSVTTLSTAIAAQQAAKATKNTDIIAECSTPGTRCSELSKKNTEQNQKFFIDLITKTNRCLITSAFQGGQTLTGPDRVNFYDLCVAKIPPVPPTGAGNATTSTR